MYMHIDSREKEKKTFCPLQIGMRGENLKAHLGANEPRTPEISFLKIAPTTLKKRDNHNKESASTKSGGGQLWHSQLKTKIAFLKESWL